MKKTFFEKHPKLILLAINLFFLALIIFILQLKIFQDAPNAEKYSLIDKAEYQIRCDGKRHIKLRENKPFLNSFRIPPYDQSKKYDFKTDENGFVLPSKIHEKADLNIFFLGGSTTECETVDELNRFPYLAGRILEAKTGKKINSYNAGKSGNSTIHSVNNLVNKIMPLNPSIIVRMDNVNDLSTLLYEGTFWNKNKTRSNLGCFSKNTDALRNGNNEWEQSPFISMVGDLNHQKKIKEEYRKILRLFIAITRVSGAKPVLMTQPNRIENDLNFSTGHGDRKFNQTYRQLYIDFQNIVRQVAREENVMLIDLALQVEGSEKYIYDSVHLNNEGSKLVAEIIARQLRKLTITN
jgi:lysophospholipase L1-like esterase